MQIGSNDGWKRYDTQTVSDTTGINRPASAQANVSEAKKNIVDGLDPFTAVKKLTDRYGVPGLVIASSLFPLLTLSEAAEAIAGPALATKNLGDAGAHTLANVVEW